MIIEESTPAGDVAASPTTGSVPEPATEARWQSGAPLPRRIWLLAARRRYLVNKRRQLRTAAILLTVAVAFLVLINITLYFGRKQETSVLIAAAPELEQVLSKYDRNEIILSLLGSAVILAGVYFITIIETHRTAGAEFNLIRQLSRVGEGKYRAKLRLRRGDNLRDVQEPFNRMTEALAQRTEEDAALAERLAAELDGDQGPAAAAAVAVELRKLAVAKRALLEES